MPDTRGVIVAVDQGTSSTKAIAVSLDGSVLHRAVRPIARRDPRPGWVEQSATEILASCLAVLREVVGAVDEPVLGIGLSTQRESALLWDRATGEPITPVLGWQDRRTAARAQAMLEAGDGPQVRRSSGLPLDPMFSALKIAHLLDEVDPDRVRSARGEIAAGTVDAFLLFALTGRHVIEAGNASRTQLLDIDRLAWDPELLALFGIPAAVLPDVVPSDATLPLALGVDVRGTPPIRAVFGDSHAALFGHGARVPGDVKVTYGTGSSVMGLLAEGTELDEGLARTVAWQIGRTPSYAFEGNVLATGATLVWLAGLLGTDATTLFDLAESVEVLHGIDLVPAFAGLAAPWWSESAEALLTGFTLATGRAALARAAVDSIVLQVEDVLAAAERSGAAIDSVLADGGPSANSFLMQLQADLSRRNVRRAPVAELSAFGAAALVAQGAGLELRVDSSERGFTPRLDGSIAARRLDSWRAAVQRTLLHSSRSVHSNPVGITVDA